jgi:hypothetical protein
LLAKVKGNYPRARISSTSLFLESALDQVGDGEGDDQETQYKQNPLPLLVEFHDAQYKDDTSPEQAQPLASARHRPSSINERDLAMEQPSESMDVYDLPLKNTKEKSD